MLPLIFAIANANSPWKMTAPEDRYPTIQQAVNEMSQLVNGGERDLVVVDTTTDQVVVGSERLKKIYAKNNRNDSDI